MISYIKESFQEITQNVTWTSRAEAQRLMIIVAVFSVLFSLFIAGVDLVFEKIIAQVL
ncbi:preprotein translocase subunit SecE [Capnocytophaga catalasegens]|uniref:Protein translocase subunit SecE n=1 Tax=Capnocytophaga catalasegens TaxID=1004260 RepID=A0AAV5ATV5_9FLAO|nr:preprotein translocase subunit SecE [Capnocytophaga catalasegens]GIZ14912.1 protein translocase subunit SecE [Capnocytophaga catalasegens]GJM49291.1 protein translocase subunit SecE [Capnocytophaga catalasegens]GJM52442.1 protein translocase subunit SecE [Capnocytophaga catalasegens]